MNDVTSIPNRQQPKAPIVTPLTPPLTPPPTAPLTPVQTENLIITQKDPANPAGTPTLTPPPTAPLTPVQTENLIITQKDPANPADVLPVTPADTPPASPKDSEGMDSSADSPLSAPAPVEVNVSQRPLPTYSFQSPRTPMLTVEDVLTRYPWLGHSEIGAQTLKTHRESDVTVEEGPAG